MRAVFSLIVALILIVGIIPIEAFAKTVTNNKNSVVATDYDGIGKNDTAVAEALAKILLGSAGDIVENSASIKYTKKNQLATITGGKTLMGIDEGIVLSTGNAIGNFDSDYCRDLEYKGNYADPDLKALVDSQNQSYKGDAAVLQFSVVATGTDFNFKYSFGSAEFDQESKFNDIFGLFVSVNGGEFENIALLPNDKIVTITNLRTDSKNNPKGNKISKNMDLEYITTDYYRTKSAFNGFSDVFTAYKKVNIGDIVTIKFAIADVGDYKYDSAIIIKKNSMSFISNDTSIGSSTGETEDIILSEPAVNGASDFKVTVDGVELVQGVDYTVSDANTKAPKINFKESANLDCTSEIKVYINGFANTVTVANSIPHDWSVEFAYDDIGHWHVCDVTDCDAASSREEHSANEYIYQNDGSWNAVCECGKVLETGNIRVDYYENIYDGENHNAVTVSGVPQNADISYSTDGGETWVSNVPTIKNVGENVVLVKVNNWTNQNDGNEHKAIILAADMENVGANDYIGVYDTEAHSITVIKPSDANVYYSTSENGAYSAQNPAFVNVGEYRVYYKVSKPNYNTVIGSAIVKITPKEITEPNVTISSSEFTYNGNSQTPTVSVLVGGVVLTQGTDYDIVYSADSANTGAKTVTVTGKGNYYGTVTKNYNIKKADLAPPENVIGKDETISNKQDGEITGVDSSMEYRAENDTEYTEITSDKISELAPGRYFVRYKGDENHNPSPEVAVNIGEGRMLKVTVPDEQIGYSLTTTTPEFEYFGSIYVEFKLEEGYSLGADFEILNNGTEPLWRNFNQTTGVLAYNFVARDFNLTVRGVVENTPPVGEIKIDENNSWQSFLNNITFDLFFKEEKNVTITASDAHSGVKSIEYIVSSEALSEEEVMATADDDWKLYDSSFTLEPNGEYVVYAKITDNDGNILYISSNGLVLDDIAPKYISLEDNGIYYGDTYFEVDETYLSEIFLDGEDITSLLDEDGGFTIPADNEEHILKAIDKAGNVSEISFEVYKIYNVTFMADGEVVATVKVNHGDDAQIPEIPEKQGFTAVWDKEAKNITEDTVVTAVYTEIPVIDTPDTPVTPDDSVRDEAPIEPTPQTGEGRTIQIYLIVMLLSLLVMISLKRYLKA